MLKPEQLDPDTVVSGEFIEVQPTTGPVITITTVPTGVFEYNCRNCVFEGNGDCESVRCHKVLWVTRETFQQYLELKLLK